MSAVLLHVLTWAGEPLPTWTELDRRDCFCMTSQCEFQGVVWLHRCWLRWSRTHIINDTIRIKDIVTDKHISIIRLLYHLYTSISVTQHKNHPKPSRKLFQTVAQMCVPSDVFTLLWLAEAADAGCVLVASVSGFFSSVAMATKLERTGLQKQVQRQPDCPTEKYWWVWY